MCTWLREKSHLLVPRPVEALSKTVHLQPELLDPPAKSLDTEDAMCGREDKVRACVWKGSKVQRRILTVTQDNL